MVIGLSARISAFNIFVSCFSFCWLSFESCRYISGGNILPLKSSKQNRRSTLLYRRKNVEVFPLLRSCSQLNPLRLARIHVSLRGCQIYLSAFLSALFCFAIITLLLSCNALCKYVRIQDVSQMRTVVRCGWVHFEHSSRFSWRDIILSTLVDDDVTFIVRGVFFFIRLK